MLIYLNGFTRKNKGFTLVELMIVIAIIGILSVVLVPKIGRSKESAKNAGVEANMRTAMAQIASIIDNYTAPIELETAIIAKVDKVLTNPYKAADQALKCYSNGTSIDQMNNPTGAVKTHYDANNKTSAAVEALFKQGSAARPNFGGMVVIAITDDNNIMGVAIYGYDGAGNPITPADKALRLTR